MSELLEHLQTVLTDRYRVDRQLGEGGMAAVFLARDLKHDREVAVKVLRPELSAVLGADRFLREIRVTAHLQHPHILPLYDSGAAGELLYYMMPLVRGETLRERLARERQLPVDEAVSITRAIAGALDYAHRQGVLHRDIKPENILLQDGQPLLADFGIALAVSVAGEERLTTSGVMVGTPAYMSPEHWFGDRIIDARSDVYALGCVVYEMLTGEPPFTGPTAQAVMAAVMTAKTVPVRERRRTVPDFIAGAVHRAIESLPADRFPTAGEFAAAMVAGTVDRRSRPSPPIRSRLLAPLAVAAAAVLGAGGGYWLRPKEAPRVRWLNIALPAGAPVALSGPSAASGWQTAIAISPDGERLVFAAPRGSTTVLATRSMKSDSVVVLPGTEGAYHPFYSPDGRWVGFFAGNLLRKVSTAGEPPVTLAEVDRITGAVWGPADRIVVLENEGFDLHLISGSGASADSVVHLTTQFGTPDVLPGGAWAVGQLSSGQLAMLSLATGKELAITRRGVLPMDSVRQADLLFGASPHWLSSGYLVYGAGDGVLMAMPFNGTRRRVLGSPVPLVTGVRMEDGFGYAEFALSHEGTLAYVPGQNQLYSNLALVSPDGRVDTLPFPRGPYTQPRVSPDGKLIAAQVRNPIGGWQILLMNLATGMRQPITVEGNYRAFPASWLPSGRAVMIGLFDPVQFLNYGARIQSLSTGRWTTVRLSGGSYMTVAPDGRSFVYSDWRTKELYLQSLDSAATKVRIPGRGIAASFSPDGRWLAWEAVDGEVVVSPVPPTGAVFPVVERGEMPLWMPMGDALVYRDDNRYYRVPVSTVGGFRAGRPQLLIAGSFVSAFAWNHAMSPDGRLLVLVNRPERTAPVLGVVTGFPAMVRELAGTSSR